MCEPKPIVDGEFACACTPQTATSYQLVNATVTKYDTEITVQGNAPCCGFGLWKPCPSGESEIFRIQNAEYNALNDTTTLTITRGLGFSGCDYDGDPDLAFPHSNTQELIIGDVGIHYYYCALCTKISDLENRIGDEVGECCYPSFSEIAAIPAPQAGQRCVAWNGGSPVMWVYQCQGESGGWKQIIGGISLLDINATAPIVYNNINGNISLDYNTDHFRLVGNKLNVNFVSAIQSWRGGVDIGLLTLTPGQSGTFLDASTVTVSPVIVGGSPLNMVAMIRLFWQIDTSCFVNGSQFSTYFSYDIYRSVDGGPYELLAWDHQKRQLTNQGYGDATVSYGNNEMQTIPLFDIIGDSTKTYRYILRYRHNGVYNANIGISQVSYDIERQFVSRTV